MFKILTLNNISVAGLDRLPRDRYEVASEIPRPDAILVRSANMHDMEIAETVEAIGRAGAGEVSAICLSVLAAPVSEGTGSGAFGADTEGSVGAGCRCFDSHHIPAPAVIAPINTPTIRPFRLPAPDDDTAGIAADDGVAAGAPSSSTNTAVACGSSALSPG